MTYLLDPESIKLFFTAPDDQIAFRQVTHACTPSSGTQFSLLTTLNTPGRPATEHFTHRVFGLPSDLFFPHHSALLQRLRSLLTPAQLPERGHHLLTRMQQNSRHLVNSPGKVMKPFNCMAHLRICCHAKHANRALIQQLCTVQHVHACTFQSRQLCFDSPHN